MATLAFLELSTLHDLDCLRGLVATALGHVLDLVDNVIALEHFAEHDVATIEPSRIGPLVKPATSIFAHNGLQDNTHEVIAVVMKN